MANKALFSTTTGGVVKDSDTMAYKEAGTGDDGTRNHPFSVVKTFFQGLLPARIAQNEADISTNEADISTNEADISTNESGVAGHDTRIDTLETYNQIEAKTVLSFETGNIYYFSDWVARRQTNGVIRCSVLWPEIPYAGSTITITLPATSLTVVDGAGNSTTVSAGHTTSGLNIDGKHIYFIITEAGAFAGLNAGMCGVLISGGGCKITLS